MRELTEAENDGYAEEFYEGIDPRIRLDELRRAYEPDVAPHTAGLRGTEVENGDST